ncbi:hypothetical protein JB92DRAFT_3032260 [Gautieria morchelliformis]|nr:hypothetical protein JB92DRAFT_3032260 [Gautieria morchelliformis]
MHHPKSLVEFSSAIEILSVPRAATPVPEERLSQTLKSLFTLAEVAARRRASRSAKKLTVKTNENGCYADIATSSSPLVNLRRSKSSGDVTVLGDNPRALNVNPDAGLPRKHSSVIKVRKCNQGFSVATSSVMPSKIPKAKPPTSLSADNSCHPYLGEDSCKPPATTFATSKPEGLNVVGDALFVVHTPQTPAKSTKNLTLAAHVPSLPKVASPFSPRTNQPCQDQTQTRPSARSSPSTGHTNASLRLTKSHWELRYEAWINSLRTHRRPRSALSAARPPPVVEELLPRSRFPEPPTNPALFPRAGMLTPKALRNYSMTSDEESRSTLDLDWAMRGWPMYKIQRTLFVHDMHVRFWFPIVPSTAEKKKGGDPAGVNHYLRNVNNGEGEERTLRRWEWDWELRWRVVEAMVEDENDRDRAECEYDVFLAENHHGDEAYAGCEVEVEGRVRTKEDEWEWDENAMEIDSVLSLL